MILETELERSESSYAQSYLRPLGSFEELLWLMDKRSPLQATLIAQVDGSTKVEQWEAALEQTQRRHPLWSAVIVESDNGRPFFQRINEPDIPLRVVEGDFSRNWEQEVAWEVSQSIDSGRGSLVRAVLLHTDTSSMLILTAHHSIVDGMSLAFAIRDVLQALSGSQLTRLDLHACQEHALGVRSQPRAQKQKVGHSLKSSPAATVYRSNSLAAPEVHSLQFSTTFTGALRKRARQEGTTVHAALIAASAIAARHNLDYGSGRDLHICSTINNRKLVGSPEDSTVFFTAADFSIGQIAMSDLWNVARRSKDVLTPARGEDGVKAALGAIDGVVQSGLDRYATGEQGGRLFLFDLHVSNLGAVSIPTSYGDLALRSLWGPAVLLGFEGEQTLGVSTVNGHLRLLHTSHTPLPAFLAHVKSILISACTA